MRDDAERRRPAYDIEADIVDERNEARIAAQAAVTPGKCLAPSIAARPAIAAIIIYQNTRIARRITTGRLVRARIDGQVHSAAIAAFTAIAAVINATVIVDVVAAVPARAAATADNRD